MTYTSWPSAVNTGFYALTESYDDNSSTTEYASGRKAVTLRNTRFTKTIACSVSLDVKSGEYSAFWTWYKDTLGGLSGAFTCTKIGSGYYRFKSVPSAGKGQLFRTVEMEIEEVY